MERFHWLVFFKNTTIFAKIDEDEDNIDRKCQEKNESAASNYVFQSSQWQHFTIPILNFTDDNYFILITGNQNDANIHHLPHCLRVQYAFKFDLALFTLGVLSEFGTDQYMVAYDHITNITDFQGKYFSNAFNTLNN